MFDLTATSLNFSNIYSTKQNIFIFFSLIHLVEGGVIRQVVKRQLRRDYHIRHIIKVQQGQAKSLETSYVNMQQLQGAFLLLIAGYGLSLLVFVMETIGAWSTNNFEK